MIVGRSPSLRTGKQEQVVLTHYLSVALRNLRSAPLASTMNVVTLALGIACFVIAYAFVLFWSTAERRCAG